MPRRRPRSLAPRHVGRSRADTIWTCNPLTVAGLRFNTLWEERTQRVSTLYVPVLLRLHARKGWCLRSGASLPLELGHLPRGCAARACPRGWVDPGLAWPLASLRARPWHSTRSHPAAALALRTTTSCSRPRPSSVRQGRRLRRRHHLLNPTRMTRRQSCSGRCVCVCAARRSPSTDAHLSRTRAIRRSRSRSPSSPSPSP